MPMTISKKWKRAGLFFLSLNLLIQPVQAQSAQVILDEMQKALELSQPQLQFTRNAPAPVQSFVPEGKILKAYTLGAGDGLEISLWNHHLQLQYSLTVSPQGQLMIPKLGVLQVQGLSPEQVAAKIQTLLRHNYKDAVQVSVVLSRVRTVQVLVTGYVQNPGFYQIPWGTRLIEVLRRAGGVQDQGSIRHVRFRHGEQERELDLFRFHFDGLLADNPLLEGQESIHIPVVKNRIALTGQFYRPGQYELMPGENLQDLVLLAGGAKPGGDPQGLLRWPKGLAGSKLPLETLSLEQVYTPQNGDILHLPLRKLPQEEKNLTIYGQVQQPGVQAYRRGMNVQDCLRLAGGPLPTANLSGVQISRMTPQGRTVLTLDLQAWMQGQNHDGETEILPGDILFIPEAFLSVRNIMELTTLVVGALGIVSVVMNLSRGQ